MQGDELMRRFDVRGAGIMTVLDKQLEWRFQNAWRFALLPSVDVDATVDVQTQRQEALKVACVRYATQGLAEKK